MEKWIVYAFLSMFFAGFTSVVAKTGLSGISSELGLTIRTLFVSILILIFAFLYVPLKEFETITYSNLIGLGVSATATALSWIFFYKAIKVGDIATVSLIDKGSILIAIFLAWLILKEPISLRVAMGMVLIMSGILIISNK